VLAPLAADNGVFRRSLADEVAIDFPSGQAIVEHLRRDLDEGDVADDASADVAISRRQAGRGATVAVVLRLRHTCDACGGRGEAWNEPCRRCDGSGSAVQPQWLDVPIPPGVADGQRLRFVVRHARGPRTRVDVRVAVG
jgi:DnaJ-class molecular chaperone